MNEEWHGLPVAFGNLNDSIHSLNICTHTHTHIYIPKEGNGNPLQYFFPGKYHGQRGLAGYSPQGHKESDTTERLKHSTAYIWHI